MSLIDTTQFEAEVQRVVDAAATTKTLAGEADASSRSAQESSATAAAAAAEASAAAQAVTDAIASIPPTPETPPAGSISVNESAKVYVDGGTLFTGTDAEKTAQIIAWLATQQPGAPQREIQMPVRRFDWHLQLPTESGGRMVGTVTPAREFGTGAIINYVGPAGSSFFKLQAEPGKYGYPSGGVSRDMHFHGIQFSGGNDKDFLPPAPSTAFDSRYVQWYWDFFHCGFVGWDNFSSGWGDGLTLGGITHFQAQDNSTSLGGSENDWFDQGSLLDSGNLSGDKPFLDWSCSKSTIGAAMISARGDCYQLRVTYGSGCVAQGTKFDSPDSAPTKGHQVRFDGGTDFGFDGCNFKGGLGILGRKGSCEIAVTNCGFGGNRALARLESTFQGVLVWGINRYGSTPRVIEVARLSQIVCLDPRITIKEIDTGRVLRPATA
jgi:hypothetical protein